MKDFTEIPTLQGIEVTEESFRKCCPKICCSVPCTNVIVVAGLLITLMVLRTIVLAIILKEFVKMNNIYLPQKIYFMIYKNYA